MAVKESTSMNLASASSSMLAKKCLLSISVMASGHRSALAIVVRFDLRACGGGHKQRAVRREVTKSIGHALAHRLATVTGGRGCTAGVCTAGVCTEGVCTAGVCTTAGEEEEQAAGAPMAGEATAAGACWYAEGGKRASRSQGRLTPALLLRLPCQNILHFSE